MTDPQTAADAAERVQRWLDGYDRSDRSDNGPRNGVVASRWTDDTPDLTVEAMRTLLDDYARLAAELEQVRGERAAIPENRYPGAWAELTGWVEEAVDDGGPIDGRELLAYMVELRHKERAETREWMRSVFGAAAVDSEAPASTARDATERGIAPEGSVS